MQTKIEYIFTLPEEKEELEIIVNSSKYYLALDDIRSFIRSKYKYSDLSAEGESLLEQIRELLPEEL